MTNRFARIRVAVSAEWPTGWPATIRALVATLALLAVKTLWLAGTAAAGEILTAPEAYQRAKAGEVVLIDVRSAREWRQTGVPAGARQVTIHQGAQGFLDGILKATGGDRTKPIALICARGNRSARARRFLEASGFTNVHDVREGMVGRGGSPGWLARKMPVEKCSVC